MTRTDPFIAKSIKLSFRPERVSWLTLRLTRASITMVVGRVVLECSHHE